MPSLSNIILTINTLVKTGFFENAYYVKCKNLLVLEIGEYQAVLKLMTTNTGGYTIEKMNLVFINKNNDVQEEKLLPNINEENVERFMLWIMVLMPIEVPSNGMLLKNEKLKHLQKIYKLLFRKKETILINNRESFNSKEENMVDSTDKYIYVLSKKPKYDNNDFKVSSDVPRTHPKSSFSFFGNNSTSSTKSVVDPNTNSRGGFSFGPNTSGSISNGFSFGPNTSGSNTSGSNTSGSISSGFSFGPNTSRSSTSGSISNRFSSSGFSFGNNTSGSISNGFSFGCSSSGSGFVDSASSNLFGFDKNK